MDFIPPLCYAQAVTKPRTSLRGAAKQTGGFFFAPKGGSHGLEQPQTPSA